MRIAIYWTPPPDDPLTKAAAAWLGRDPFSGATGTPAIPLDDMASARRYGFHATLKPPFALADGWDGTRLHAAAARLAANHTPFDLPPLRPAMIGRFVALTLAAPSPAMQALADALVTGLDPARRPPEQAEIARRRAKPLSAAEDANLRRYGYPHVLDTWLFHMTLTDALPQAALVTHLAAAEAHFAGVLDRHRVTAVTLFHEPAPGAAFTAGKIVPLG